MAEAIVKTAWNYFGLNNSLNSESVILPSPSVSSLSIRASVLTIDMLPRFFSSPIEM